MSVIDAIEAKEVKSQQIKITPELVARFKSNWRLLVNTHHTINFALPFYHLKNEKKSFWQLKANIGYDKAINVSRINSFTRLNEIVAYASIDNDLFYLLKNQTDRNLLKNVLLETYFTEKKEKYIEKHQVTNFYLQDIENSITTKSPENQLDHYYHANEEDNFVRTGAFRKIVTKVYDDTCCVSGLKIIPILDAQLIDACHIIPFKHSYNNHISNGIALSPSLHRAFDRGLFSINQNYQVIVSNMFNESGNTTYGIKHFHKKTILLPDNFDFYPNLDYFRWHEKNVFKSN